MEQAQTDVTQTPETSQRQQQWQQIGEQVREYRDGLGKPLDAGIVATVHAITAFGFETRQSCEGHLSRAVAAPWVDIKPKTIAITEEEVDAAFDAADTAENEQKPEEEIDNLYEKAHALRKESKAEILREAGRVQKLLGEFYAGRKVPHDRTLMIRLFGQNVRLQSQGAELQDGVDDITKRKRLQEYRQEMNDFTDFLKGKFFKE